ncbi:MAG: type II toxin-antitoxin system PemK/MazF family toxin [Gemmatimonadaceae bacterium]
MSRRQPASPALLRRGTVWWAALAEPSGSGPGYRRPVVVVQADAFNASHIRTVVVVALTSNLALADAPGNVLVDSRGAGLPKDSVANVSQIITIDKRFLENPCGRLRPRTMEAISMGMRLVLDL